MGGNNRLSQLYTTQDDGFFIFHDLIGHGATYVQGREQLSTRVEGFDPYDLFGYYFEPYLEIEHDCNGSDFEVRRFSQSYIKELPVHFLLLSRRTMCEFRLGMLLQCEY